MRAIRILPIAAAAFVAAPSGIIASGADGGLARQARSLATSYISAYFNIDYRCPSGWSIGAIDTTLTSFSFTSTRSGRPPIYVSGRRFATPQEAENYNGRSTFQATKLAFDSSSGRMPAVFAIWDTATKPGISTAGIILKYAPDDSLVYRKVAFCASESFSMFQHEVRYFTTVEDYDIYKTQYSQHWTYIRFVDTTTSSGQPLPKTAAGRSFTIAGNTLSISRDEQLRLKLDLFDLMGRRAARVFDSARESAAAVDLDISVDAPSNYILKATTPQGSEGCKVLVR